MKVKFNERVVTLVPGCDICYGRVTHTSDFHGEAGLPNVAFVLVDGESEPQPFAEEFLQNAVDYKRRLLREVAELPELVDYPQTLSLLRAIAADEALQ